eukprot:271798-Lingulodinium_polyedra.AAC.1
MRDPVSDSAADPPADSAAEPVPEAGFCSAQSPPSRSTAQGSQASSRRGRAATLTTRAPPA